MYVYSVSRNHANLITYIDKHICSEACHICPARFKCYTMEWIKLRRDGKPGIVLEHDKVPYGFLLDNCGRLTSHNFYKVYAWANSYGGIC